MSIPKCDHCPVKDCDTECIARTLGHDRFCVLAETRCDYRRLIVERSTGNPSSIRCPEDPPEHEEREAIPKSVSFAVVQCQHRTKMPACGCEGKWRCERDNQDVTWDQCIACKSEELNIKSTKRAED